MKLRIYATVSIIEEPGEEDIEAVEDLIPVVAAVIDTGVQLGDGTTTDSNIPVQTSEVANIVSIRSGAALWRTCTARIRAGRA